MKRAILALAIVFGVVATSDAGPLRKLASRGKSVLGNVVKCVGGCR